MLQKAILILLLGSAQLWAEPVKLTMKVGEKKQHTFKNVADDPKQLNKSDDIFVSRDFDDPKLVAAWIIPSKPGVIYFGIASTKDGKTLVDDIVVEVTGTVPPGPGPKPPEPTVNKYRERLTAIYMVSPDKPSKDALVVHLEALNKAKYSTKEDALKALRNHQIAGVQSTRTEIAKILSETLYTPEAFQQVITDVVSVLKELP